VEEKEKEREREREFIRNYVNTKRETEIIRKYSREREFIRNNSITSTQGLAQS